MDVLSSSSSYPPYIHTYPPSPSASVRWLIVSIPHSSPFHVDARGTAAASLLALPFLPGRGSRQAAAAAAAAAAVGAAAVAAAAAAAAAAAYV